MDGKFTGSKRDKHKSVEWYTPKWIFDRLKLEFDLDPCSPHDMKTCVPAIKKLTIHDDGLSTDWHVRVWMNPPYGKTTKAWTTKFIDHNNGCALLFSRTDAHWCQEMMLNCSALLFLAGRVSFVPGNENKSKANRSGAGSVLFGFGDECRDAVCSMQHYGTLFINWDKVNA